MESIVNKVLDILKGSPAFVFAIVVLYMVIQLLGGKIDQTNVILTDMNRNMEASLERMACEEEDTKDFILIQNEILERVKAIQN
jgi:hypothetical protein